MGRPAQVKSIDAIQELSAAMKVFRGDVSAALDELDMEIRRALQWIGHDLRDYWKQELHRSENRANEARVRYENAMMFRRAEGERGGGIEEKKAMEQAKQHVELARRKIEAVSHWTVAVERAVNEYRGSRAQFLNWIDGDCPKAVAALGRMISALETYVSLGSSMEPSESVARATRFLAESPESADNSEKKHAEPSNGVPPSPDALPS